MKNLSPLAWVTALLVSFGVLVVGCSDGPPAADAASPASTPNTRTDEDRGDAGAARAAPPAPAPVICEGKTGAPGDGDIELTSSGIAREAMIHVPPSHDGIHGLPVVLVLHPLLLTYKDMRKLAQVEPHADDAEHGFIALFPNGIDRSWNAGECCGEAKDEQIDDVGFIRELLEHVKSKWCVDPARIYAMGFSNGAFLSHRLACELPGGLRAIVPVAGTLGIPASSCKPERPTPVLAIHGTDDDLVPYEGGPPKIPRGASFGTFLSPAETDAFWAKANGCGPAGEPYFIRGEVSCARHEGCTNDASVGLCTVTGGGHQWPGPKSLPAMGHLTKDIHATQAAIDLFRRHGL